VKREEVSHHLRGKVQVLTIVESALLSPSVALVLR
jgi:hypothetical protein